MNTKYTYKAEEIFEEIEGDPENILMNIPKEILDQNGWKEGDQLHISVKEGSIIISKNG